MLGINSNSTFTVSYTFDIDNSHCVNDRLRISREPFIKELRIRLENYFISISGWSILNYNYTDRDSEYSIPSILESAKNCGLYNNEEVVDSDNNTSSIAEIIDELGYISLESMIDHCDSIAILCDSCGVGIDVKYVLYNECKLVIPKPSTMRANAVSTNINLRDSIPKITVLDLSLL